LAALAGRRMRPGLRPAIDPAATHQRWAPVRRGTDRRSHPDH
jgi:hypothetical protein